jgi:hypothetical protein
MSVTNASHNHHSIKTIISISNLASKPQYISTGSGHQQAPLFEHVVAELYFYILNFKG